MAESRRPPLASWSKLFPRETSSPLLESADSIARLMTRRLIEEVPLSPEFGKIGYLRAVLRACRDGTRVLLETLWDGRRPTAAELNTLGLAGAKQAEMGIPLEVLLHAYRIAAKVVWDEMMARAAATPMDSATMTDAFGRLLEYLDEVSVAVGRSYLQTREQRLRQRDRERDRLLHRLLAGDTSAEFRRLAAAQDLDLNPPYRVFVVRCDPNTVEVDRVLSTAWKDVGAHFVVDEPGTWMAIVRVPVDASALATAAHTMFAKEQARVAIAVGSMAASLADVPLSAEQAKDALELGERLQPRALLHDARELGIFANIAADPERLQEFVNDTLGPLLKNESRRRQLLPTLETVLLTRGIADAAARLNVHRHTVMYRIDRLSEILRCRLDDPATRYRLWLAVKGVRLLETTKSV